MSNQFKAWNQENNATVNNNTSTGNRGNFEQADAFINITLPDENDNPVQIGSINIRNSDWFGAAILEALTDEGKPLSAEDTEAMLARIVDNLSFNFRVNNNKNGVNAKRKLKF